MNDIYEGSYYTWNWTKMTVTGGSGNSRSYELRWNDELNILECKDMREPAATWQRVKGEGGCYDKAIESYKHYIAEQELLH